MLDRMNALYDRLRGVILLLLPLFTIIPALLALLAVMGFGPVPTPNSRIVAVQNRTAALELQFAEHVAASEQVHLDSARVLRALQLDLCDRHRDNRLLLAQMDLDCAALTRGGR